MIKPIDPDAVFNKLDRDRKSGELSKAVTTASVRYQGSITHEGLVERINEDGSTDVGQFRNGTFIICYLAD